MKKLFTVGFLVLSLIINGCAINTHENPEINQAETQLAAYEEANAQDDTISSANNPVDIVKNHIISYGMGLSKDFKDIMDYKIGEDDISLPFDYSCKQITDTNVIFHIHGFLFLDYTYVLFEETRDNTYKDFIMTYMVDWAKNNPTPLEGNDWAWNDDAVARRVLRFSYYLSQWENDFNEEEYQLLLRSLKSQVELLATETFYSKNHNHGMFQDMGVIAYALLIADGAESEMYLDLAQKRSREYFEFAFSSDGVHKEHSPSYHMNISEKLLFFKDIYFGRDEEFSDYLVDLYAKTSEFITQITMPDGTLPSIGDSGRAKLRENVYDTPQYLYAFSGGQKGEKPADNYVSPNGGYAVMRSSWEDTPEEATYLLFMAATHSSAHKHGDDLGFILYHKGDLFTEAGSRDYHYKEDMTNYSYSGYAHNVLLINEEMFPIQYGPAGSHNIYKEALNTKITDYDISSKTENYAEGSQVRFKDIEQNRRVTYNKASNKVIIEDNIINSRQEDIQATLLFHVADGIEVKKTDNNKFTLMRDGNTIAITSVKGNSNIETTVFTGETQEPPYNTWIFEGKKEPRIGSLIKVDFDVKDYAKTYFEIELK